MGYLEERIKRTGKKDQPVEMTKQKTVKGGDRPKIKVPDTVHEDVDMSYGTGTYKVQKHSQQA